MPFTTSTLVAGSCKSAEFFNTKNDAYRTAAVMRVFQRGEGTIGLITYLRTDSTRIAAEADTAARAYIEKTYGENISTTGKKEEAAKGHIQDA